MGLLTPKPPPTASPIGWFSLVLLTPILLWLTTAILIPICLGPEGNHGFLAWLYRVEASEAWWMRQLDPDLPVLGPLTRRDASAPSGTYLQARDLVRRVLPWGDDVIAAEPQQQHTLRERLARERHSTVAAARASDDPATRFGSLINHVFWPVQHSYLVTILTRVQVLAALGLGALGLVLVAWKLGLHAAIVADAEGRKPLAHRWRIFSGLLRATTTVLVCLPVLPVPLPSALLMGVLLLGCATLVGLARSQAVLEI